jgi:HAD superfamily hydrolase (TIGR01549 family)
MTDTARTAFLLISMARLSTAFTNTSRRREALDWRYSARRLAHSSSDRYEWRAFINALLRETGHTVSSDEAERLQKLHGDAFKRYASQVRPLPGAKELLTYLTTAGVPWAIATSGRLESASLSLELLGVSAEVPIITRDLVRHAKPDPDLFLAAAEKLGVEIRDSVVIGDSIWDLLAARRARALGVGLLSGGYGRGN